MDVLDRDLSAQLDGRCGDVSIRFESASRTGDVTDVVFNIIIGGSEYLGRIVLTGEWTAFVVRHAHCHRRPSTRSSLIEVPAPIRGALESEAKDYAALY